MSSESSPKSSFKACNKIVCGEIIVSGVRIAYQVSGDGPALVCCHAMGCDQSLWDQHRSRFSVTHKLITFDQRGSGDSDHPPFNEGSGCFYTVDTFAEDLCGVLDSLGIEKAQILGFSMGAVAALRFAIRWPHRVDRLVLASAMASRLPDEIIQRAKAVERMLDAEGLDETYKFYFSGPLFEGMAKSGKFHRMIEGFAKKATPQGFLGCFRVTIDRPSMVNDLHKIQAPTLILVGENDVHYLPEADLMVSKIDNARKVIVKNAGHAMSDEAPKVFQDEVMNFLS